MVDDLLEPVADHRQEVPQLSVGDDGIQHQSTALRQQQVLVSTAIPATLQAVQSSWRSVAVPVVLITAQLLVLCLLLLFLVRHRRDRRARPRGGPGQAARTRAVADRRVRAVRAGAAARAGAAGRHAGRVGAPRQRSAGSCCARAPRWCCPPLAWAAAGLATAGGLLAVVLAARRTLRRPVVEEWRRSGRRPAGRGWVVGRGPGHRARPRACSTWRSPGRSARPGTARWACSSPGCSGWPSPSSPPGCCRWPAGPRSPGPAAGAASACSSRSGMSPGAPAGSGPRSCSPPRSRSPPSRSPPGRRPRQRAARRRGTRSARPRCSRSASRRARNLGTIVDRADPGGRMAAAVDRYTSLSSGTAGLTDAGRGPAAVRPGRRLAARLHRQPLAALARKLDPRAPAPVILTGECRADHRGRPRAVAAGLRAGGGRHAPAPRR